MKLTCTIPLRSWLRRLLIITIAMLLLSQSNAGATEVAGSVTLGEPPELTQKFLQAHCYDCHVGEQAEGQLDLAALLRASEGPSGASGSDDAALIWARIHDRVAEGEMPPPDAAELTAAEIEAFCTPTADWIQRYQRQTAESIGRVGARRLTNLQLERTLHDLLGIDIPLATGFSEEPRTAGFTTVAAGQAMSHFQLEQHLQAVDAALAEAFRRVSTPPDHFDRTFSPEQIAQRRPGQRNREPELREGLAAVWSSRLIFYGRMNVTTAKESGWYRCTLKASALKPPQEHGVWCSVRTGPCISSAPLLQTIGGFEATEMPQEWSFVGWLPAGHRVEVRPADATLPMARFNGGQVGAGEGEPQNVPGVALHWVRMERIHQGPDDAAIVKRLFGDLRYDLHPKKGLRLRSRDPKADSARLIQAFAERAFRRPTTDAELEPYVVAVHQALDQGQPLADALRGGYRTLLCSPRFLYFTESPGRLDHYAVASRLSYFLWNRLPDATLLELAAGSQLQDPQVIRAQVRRMLADPRGADFVKDFAEQWLDLSLIDFTEPDPRLYRDFDTLVQYSMLQETHHYLQKMLDENLSVSHLIDSDFTLLNSRLARFYGIAGVSGDAVRRVNLRPQDRRGGLITQGAILKVTANGTTTSPVIRGAWVSERLLGQPIAPPPQNVPAIEPDIRGATTIREQLAQHTSVSSCAVCHVKMDPPGFALENYDPSGKWRDVYRLVGAGGKSPRLRVDPSHVLPDGAAFADVAEFKQLILRQPRRLAHGVAEKLVTYGTGATVRFADLEPIEQIVDQSSASEFGFRSLIESVATSPLFLTK